VYDYVCLVGDEMLVSSFWGTGSGVGYNGKVEVHSSNRGEMHVKAGARSA